MKCKKFSGRGFLLFFELGVKSAGFHLRKYKKSFPLRKFKIFFNIRARKFLFWKYIEFFSGWIFFFAFWGLGLVSGPGSPEWCYWQDYVISFFFFIFKASPMIHFQWLSFYKQFLFYDKHKYFMTNTNTAVTLRWFRTWKKFF